MTGAERERRVAVLGKLARRAELLCAAEERPIFKIARGEEAEALRWAIARLSDASKGE